MAPTADQLTAPPAAPGLPPGYDPNTGTVPAKSTAVAPAPATGQTGGASGDWTDPSAVERFATSATDAIGQGIQGAIGMGKEILNPPGPNEKAKIAHIAKTLILDPMAKQEMEARTAKTPWESIGHSIAEAVPMVGPWAADVAEKTGTQAGGGDWAGAAGTMAGNVLVAKAIEHLSPAAETKPVGAVEPLEAPALPEGNVIDVKGRVVDEGKPHPISEQPAGKLDDLGTRLPDLQTAEMRNPNVTFGRTGGKFGRAVDITHQVLRQNEAEKLPPQPKLPDTGTYPAIQTDDGGIYPDVNNEYGTHIRLAQALGLPADRIVSGGWLTDGDYEGSPRSDAGRYGERARRARAVMQLAATAQPTIEHRENVATFGSGSEAPQKMSQVRLQQNGKTIGRVNYVIDPETKIASVKAQGIDNPNLRGKGYGQKMVLAAADQARANGATALTSDLQGTTTMDAARVWDKLAAKGHPVEKIPSKPGSPGYTMDLTKPSPLPQYGQAASEQGNLPGQKIQLGDLQAKYVGRETPQIKTPEVAPAYHPDLQKMADKYGVVHSPSGGTEASFITPDGKFIQLPAGVTHDYAIDDVRGATSLAPGPSDNRIGFLNDTGAVRVRISNDRAGKTTHISVPAGGVTTEQIPAIQQAIAAAGRNGNVVMERADVSSETKDQLTMSKDFPRPGDTAQYLRQIQAHPDQHPESDLMTNERQSPLKEPYAIEMRNPDGTTHTETVEGFSIKDAIRTAQNKFPDASEWSSADTGGERTPSTEYVVPTGKLASMPVQVGRELIQTMYHELGHAMIGEKEGLTVKGMLRHTHPDLGRNTRAAVAWDVSDLYQPGTRQFKPDKVDAIVINFMGGTAADEVFNNLPRAANHNFDPRTGGGDGNQAYRALTAAGYTPAEALDRMHAAVDKSKEYLTQPAVSAVIKENAGVRESGLSKQYHYSPERLKNMHLEAQRRIANGTNTEGTDNGAAGGGGTQDHPAVVARGEGGISETAGQVPGEVAKTPAAEAAPEVTPQQQVITEMSKLGDPDKAQMQLAERAGRVRIKALETAPGARQQGHAAALLSKLADSADKHGVTLELTASPYAPVGFTDKILDSDELQAFYKRHGFVMEPGHDPAYGYMIREPKSPETAPEVNPHDLVERAQQALAAGDKKTAADLLAQARAALQSSELTTAEKKKTSIGFINPKGEFEGFNEFKGLTAKQMEHVADESEHSDFASNRDTTLTALGKKGWVRKAGAGTYDVQKLTPTTQRAIEHDIIQDHPAKIYIEGQERLYPFSYDDFIEKYNGDLSRAMQGSAQGDKVPELVTAEIKKPSEPWAETAGKAMAENGAFTINPRTGEIPNTGHWLEAGPELRQVSDKPSTPAEIQKFAAQPAVKKMLAKYPELQIGGYKNDAGKYELNLSASSADPEAAKAVATKLDQESTWDAGGQKLNPAGGKNKQTEFPDYPMDERLRDLAPKTPGNTISTRYPTAVAATEDPLRHDLVLGPEHLENNPALTEKYAKAVQNVPGFKPPEGATAIQTVRAFIDHVKDNLKALYNQSTPEEQARNKEWYDGAHSLTKDLANQHGYTHPQTAGVTAALSPQKDWDMNVSLAKRLTDIIKNHADEKASPEMIQKGKDIVSQTQEVNPKANKALQKMLPKIQGKSLNELTNPTQRAAWVRLYDEAHNPREFEKIGPDGKPQGLRTNLDGSPSQVAWGSFNEINKALSILKDGSRENISRTLGGAHKVRSFYNNIIDPNSERGDVTIDTHAVAAGLLRPLSGFHTEVKQNFNSPNSAVAGLKGTYPLYHAAYTEAAKELDIPHPRMLQSVVWEKIRNIFPAEFKTAENNDAINAIWKEKEDGKITADQARQRILDYAESHRPVSEGQQSGADQGQLPLRGVSGESTEGRERNRVSAGTPVEDDTSFNFGANAPEVEAVESIFSQPKPKKMKGAVSALSLISALKKAGSKPK